MPPRVRGCAASKSLGSCATWQGRCAGSGPSSSFGSAADGSTPQRSVGRLVTPCARRRGRHVRQAPTEALARSRSGLRARREPRGHQTYGPADLRSGIDSSSDRVLRRSIVASAGARSRRRTTAERQRREEVGTALRPPRQSRLAARAPALATVLLPAAAELARSTVSSVERASSRLPSRVAGERVGGSDPRRPGRLDRGSRHCGARALARDAVSARPSRRAHV